MSSALKRLPDSLRELYRFGILRDLDVYLTETLMRRYETEGAEDYVLLACSLASRVVADSHVCLDLKDISAAWLTALSPLEDIKEDSLSPQTIALCEKLAAADDKSLIKDSKNLIGDSESHSPIIATSTYVYIRRYWNFESSIADHLKEMAKDVGGITDSGELKAELDKLELDGEQRIAAITALNRKLTVISGGPGTGKTYVAARILYLLSTLAAKDGRVPTVRMAAPTGKAAANLEQSVTAAIKKIPGAKPLKRKDDDVACTIDRLLGYDAHSPYFRHGKDKPLAADVVLIDEASMIDLPKMAKLLDALKPSCRLILLGDMHQLASVAPGSVMADICASTRMKDCVVEITKSRRFVEGGPVHQLGQLVKKADKDDGGKTAWELIDTLYDDKYITDKGDTRIKQFKVPEFLATHSGAVDTEFAKSVITGYAEFTKAKTFKDAFAALATFRILCALRKGPHGVNTVNKMVESILSGKAKFEDNTSDLPDWEKINVNGEFYDHRVIMITRNDYQLELFNGDIGIIMPDEDDPSTTVAWFEKRKSDGKENLEDEKTISNKPRKVPCRLLPEHDTAFATTVHKAQGSEFNHVLMLLPYLENKLLTKEMVYTAITRTTGKVDIWANQEVFQNSIINPVKRSGGLKTQLDK